MLIGHRIGAYEIGDRLGVGGMGEVYRATDTNLKRQVAIKVLPSAVAADPDRLARFQREAEVLAALNHPNIAHIHGLERGDPATSSAGPPVSMALVMELVEGPTLADRIAQGPIPLADALPIAKQIADALEGAHEQGIVHRDLKPANIKVRADGTVKVLDFGLAKALDVNAGAASGDISTSPTISMRATQAGLILGTAAYMSPEQAAGKPVDKRTDLWSFGVVMMEMLTGRRVFEGETISHVLASVLKDTPDFSVLPADTPAAIRKLLRRCLEKDRRKRLADAADARLEIEEALAPTDEIARETVRLKPDPTRGPWIAGAFVAGVLLAAAAAALFMRTRPEVAAPPALTYTPLSFEPGGNMWPVWSPDGKGIAFAARQNDDQPYQIYVRYLDSSSSTELTHLSGISMPVAWTTTGRIVFRSSTSPEGMWSVSQTGGQAEPLLAMDGDGTSSATVSRDGSALAYYTRQDSKFAVWISAPPGTPAKRYAPAPFETELSVNAPVMQFSPDGRNLLLMRNGTRGEESWLLPYPPDPKQSPRQLFKDRFRGSLGTPRFSWMPDNRRIALSLSLGSESSRLYVADTVTEDVSLLSGGTTMQAQPAVSPDGTRVAFSELITNFDAVQVDVGTGDVSPLRATRRSEQMPAWSMRATTMAYVTDRAGGQEIWIHEPGRPDRPVVTSRDFPPGTTQFFMTPLVSPDGARIIYEHVEPAGTALMWLSSIQGGAPVRVTNAPVTSYEAPGGWSPDGSWFAYLNYNTDGVSVAKVRTTGNAAAENLMLAADARQAAGADGPDAVPVWSAAGDWILYLKGTWRLLSPDGKTERDLGIKADVCALSRDGVEIYCVRSDIQIGASGATLVSRRVSGGPERVIARLAPHEAPDSELHPSLMLTWSPDGRHLTYSASRRESNLWLLEGIKATK